MCYSYSENNNFLNNRRLCSNEGCVLQGPKCFGGGVFVCMYSILCNLTLCGSSSFIGNSAYNGGGVRVGMNSIGVETGGGGDIIYEKFSS